MGGRVLVLFVEKRSLVGLRTMGDGRLSSSLGLYVEVLDEKLTSSISRFEPVCHGETRK